MAERRCPEAFAAALAGAYRRVAATRMAGLPVLNPALAVEAVGFARRSGSASLPADGGVFGVLLTPWCMNLVWAADEPAAAAPVGQPRRYDWGEGRYLFLGACEPDAGPFEQCSLYSPMDAFASQEDARAVALAVLAQLRRCAEDEPEHYARRGFFGRLGGRALAAR
ncbi:[NiFe]-hydrogenase assembly chaperone HybE [Frateuria defendens]|uniref:[NiFe]-hydrogenase assembly chaperone HybE n=1 Tax=Frateuria defendens TaxID=2219559 RepID=UPI00066FD591|nr:[NiFe]-hydrogenase assembly chaperone HybE [Frateuria defendens]